MNLGIIEEHLLRALAPRAGKGVLLKTGPAFFSAATGIEAELFIHAVRFIDHGGITDEGAWITREPLKLVKNVSGFRERRPASIEIEITVFCTNHFQAQALSGLVICDLLEALEGLEPPLLSDPSDRNRQLRFIDPQAYLHALTSTRNEYEGASVAGVVMILRLDGFLEVRLARKGGLERRSSFDIPLKLIIHANPKGNDVAKEYIEIANPGSVTVGLSGWVLKDDASRPHKFTFPISYQLSAGKSVRLWTGRGTDNPQNLYWGRRKAVWTNSGDIASLLDPDGIERARAEC